jgi:hypothetical protein
MFLRRLNLFHFKRYLNNPKRDNGEKQNPLGKSACYMKRKMILRVLPNLLWGFFKTQIDAR